MKARRYLMAVVPALLLSSGVLAANVADVLRKAEEADKNVSYRGMKTAVVRFSGGMTTASLKVVHLKPDLTRIDHFSPEAVAGVIVIQHGRNAWKYRPSEDVWEQLYPSFALPEGLIRKEALENYQLQLIGQENVAGRSSFVIHAVPKRSGEFPRRVWVDREYYLVLATQVENSRGAIVNSSRYTSIEFNPGDISPAIFEITGQVKPAPPRSPGARRPKPAKPAYLPEGYRMLAHNTMTIDGRLCLHTQFSNGANTISLFQRPVDSQSSQSEPRGKFTNVLSWVRGGMLFTLVGSVSRAELQKIADSVR